MKILAMIFIIFIPNIIIAQETISMPSKVKYSAKKMLESERVLDIADGSINKYYTERQTLESKVIIKNGIFYDIYNKKINTFGNIGDTTKYVMDKYGNIFINMISKRSKHSFFMAGKDVSDAGWMKIFDGKLVEIDHSSGHYRPTFLNTLNIILELFEKGVKYINITSQYNHFLGSYSFYIGEEKLKNQNIFFNINQIRFINYSV